MENGLNLDPVIKAGFIDADSKIAVVVERNGERRLVGMFDNPFWPEIDREWHERHPDA